IYSVQKGKRIGSVKDVVYDGEHSRLLALTLEEPGLISPDRRILPYERIKSIGRDAIMIENEGILITEKEAGEDIRRLPQKGSLPGKKVITQSGNYLGTITDVLIDRSTGKSISYEVSGGITKDIGAG
ncbi:MAG TPA: PRC-barrel domain-containing protein, partial [Armatimonadota bacterium]|nr:PRC-barrel domain-containing protein [Armatimonadota bacterium]